MTASLDSQRPDTVARVTTIAPQTALPAAPEHGVDVERDHTEPDSIPNLD